MSIPLKTTMILGQVMTRNLRRSLTPRRIIFVEEELEDGETEQDEVNKMKVTVKNSDA